MINSLGVRIASSPPVLLLSSLSAPTPCVSYSDELADGIFGSEEGPHRRPFIPVPDCQAPPLDGVL